MPRALSIPPFVVAVALAVSGRALAQQAQDAQAPAALDRSDRAPPHRLVTSLLAQACVAAAWRASGLGLDDARLDELLSRARTRGWLPDVRLGATRLLTDAEHTSTPATTDGTTFFSAVGSNVVLELRLTWRLERLVYAGDEPALERARLDRQEARAKLAGRTLDALFDWQRAIAAIGEAVAGSHEELSARLRAWEDEVSLDVLTGGWFSRRGAEPP